MIGGSSSATCPGSRSMSRCPSDEGDGLAMARRGGYVDTEGRSWWCLDPVSRVPRRGRENSLFPHFTDLAKPGIIG